MDKVRQLVRSSALPAHYIPPYAKILTNFRKVRQITDHRPLTLSEKILYSHIQDVDAFQDDGPNEVLKLLPDRVAMQDASAQMALLQFITTKLTKSLVPASIHCDHLIVGSAKGATEDLSQSLVVNQEIFDFLSQCCAKYGIEFWKPGSGIIHQIVLENFAAPGLMMLGTDSHTPNAGGLTTLAIGCGGADAVDAMTMTPWELSKPKIMGINIKNKFRNSWVSPKDIITYLNGKLTVRGGTGFILEYFGSGLQHLSCTGMATISNMGAELGATTSIFPYSDSQKRYLHATNRSTIADVSDVIKDSFLVADENCHYDKVVEVDLSSIEPNINGPFTPDLSTPISQYGAKSLKEKWPQTISAGLIGSCTNSSYQDMTKAAHLMLQAASKGLKPRIPFYVTPGSEQIRATMEKDGLLEIFRKNGATILANACGQCIGQWDRNDIPKQSQLTNSIFTSFNRNFRGRNDGNRNTMNFLTSPEIVTAMAYSGNAQFNPLTDSIELDDGSTFRFEPPVGEELPLKGFAKGRDEFYPIATETNSLGEIKVSPESDRLQLLEPFEPWDGKELQTTVILKVKGKCTTDHISAAGAWLKYKGHLGNIAHNTLIGATNAEIGQVNEATDLDGQKYDIPQLMMKWKKDGRPWSVIAEHNYGEGSAREHAALQPRFLGGRIILTKSFARIHETNLKKQGMLPLTFVNEDDYGKISSGDILETVNLVQMVHGKGACNNSVLQIRIIKPNGQSFIIDTKHSMSPDQVKFFEAGSAMNYISQNTTL